MLHVTYKPSVQQEHCCVQLMEATKTTGIYDFNIFDYSNATYAAPSQIHVIRCEHVSVSDNVLAWVTRGP